MTRRHRNISPPALTATEWGLILRVLGAYQHHAACRDLHGKVVLRAKAAGGPVGGALSLVAAVSNGRGVNSMNPSALLG